MYPGEPDDEHELRGRPARASDVRRISALVKSYYAAAGRSDGTAACRLMYLPLAESVAEFVNEAPSPGRCASLLSKFFRQRHRRLSAESTALRVTSVRVDLNVGTVRLDFKGGKSSRYTIVHRESGSWKMQMLFDVGHPILVE